ncbi:AGR054Cp [Eremothecium gossypii ATCC 10895]|uniref:AGR054Cp n=1 Tax=Eremothecium gossypii (strain ATCC 10895 / CBS 109.51 / FGSC 9923 / NRRL Y-1056) TaxID=284811 RepID=Q750A3_EREGS|nr:AGR054Cp [Eremothecium gossypii ATCC 10895]AAS54543.2 AGR054Cp [Eremothecium gossypii ATCC 10895]AEY98875.1 FAGR054Cp [Eremothecium gossypii FDAG1]
MKNYSLTFVEIVNRDKSTTRCQWYHDATAGSAGYGAVSNRAHKDVTQESFHNLVHEVVIPKVVRLTGNKVIKTTMTFIDGYDCYYTTNDAGQVLVCFASVGTPKILPLRALTRLKAMETSDDAVLHRNLDAILKEFHQELLSYHDPTSSNATDQDLQTIVSVMNDNIDKFLQRQERISLLVDQTSQLNQSSFNFQRKAVRIKRKMWWNNIKFWTVSVSVGLCALFILWMILHI